MTPLLVATTNRGKLREIKALLAGAPYEIVTLDAWPAIATPAETGATFGDNARAKALYYAAQTGQLTMAEDSGLEIDALGGAPGVESARFGGVDTTYPEKFARIRALRRAARRRLARFVLALARRRLFETGTVEGRSRPNRKARLLATPDLLLSAVRATLAEVARGNRPSAIAARRSAPRVSETSALSPRSHARTRRQRYGRHAATSPNTRAPMVLDDAIGRRHQPPLAISHQPQAIMSSFFQDLR